MKRILVISATFLLNYSAYSQKTEVHKPTSLPRENVIDHKGFSVSYSSAYVLSSWASYVVPQDNKDYTDNIKPKYAEDPQVTTRSASKKDYKNSGYLMAQLINYQDIAQIEGAIEESFFMTNIVPMKPAFHKFIWTKSEDLVRTWAKEKGDLIVICGPILKESPFPTFGDGKVAIPKNYYKVVYDPINHEAIAFRFKNSMSSGKLKGFSIPVAELEELTGLDFFPDMDAEKTKALKSTVNYDEWDFESVDGK